MSRTTKERDWLWNKLEMKSGNAVIWRKTLRIHLIPMRNFTVYNFYNILLRNYTGGFHRGQYKQYLKVK